MAAQEGGEKSSRGGSPREQSVRTPTPPPATHPHDHHLHRHVLGEADRGPEVHGQGHEQVQDGHQVLPVDRWSGREDGSWLRSGSAGTPSPGPKGNQDAASKRDRGEEPRWGVGGRGGHGKMKMTNALCESTSPLSLAFLPVDLPVTRTTAFQAQPL